MHFQAHQLEEKKYPTYHYAADCSSVFYRQNGNKKVWKETQSFSLTSYVSWIWKINSLAHFRLLLMLALSYLHTYTLNSDSIECERVRDWETNVSESFLAHFLLPQNSVFYLSTKNGIQETVSVDLLIQSVEYRVSGKSNFYYFDVNHSFFCYKIIII